MSRPCALYRHFDEHSVLLYVGVTDTPSNRGSSHASTAEWAPYASHGSIQWFLSRATALAAERHAIVTEKPVFNEVHAPGQAFRVRAYLARRDRRQVLEELPDRRRPEPKAELQPSNDDGLVSLREAVLRGLVPCGYEAVKKAAQRQGFPSPSAVGPRHVRLYLVDDLALWSERRRSA